MTRYEFLPFYGVFFLLAALDRIASTVSSKSRISESYLSYKWLFVLPFCVYLILVVSSITELLIRVQNIRVSVSIAGGLCYMLGSYLRRKSIRDLGESWSIYTEIKSGQKLVVNGIYRFFKHPYYLAVMFELGGVCLVANAFYTLIVALIIQGSLLILRIFFEEQLLVNFFGDQYRNYRKWKLI